MSSSEKPGMSSRVSKSTKPASHSSPHGMSSKVMFDSVPRSSSNKSGLSTQLGAMRTNSCIHFDMRTPSLCNNSCIFSITEACEDTWRMTLHKSGSRVLITRTITCGNKPLPTITSAARGCVARFTTSATRSFPTRGSGKCTTNCSNIIMPSRWKAINDLHLSSMENWYKSFSTMWRKGGLRKRSTNNLTIPDSISEPRMPSSKEKLYKVRKDSTATLTSSWLASCTRRDKVSAVFIASLFSSKTLTFFTNCSVTRRSSVWSLSRTCVSKAGIFLLTIFFSVVISSARLRSEIKQT
mmetsp:Transcript_24961/g.71707  ORF Transcript_24961/g.71707 Transcript_24961/m.71707 type:complete len:296 (-) Transcript_24961:575-1462(-)